jgi:hypothetical protein
MRSSQASRDPSFGKWTNTDKHTFQQPIALRVRVGDLTLTPQHRHASDGHSGQRCDDTNDALSLPGCEQVGRRKVNFRGLGPTETFRVTNDRIQPCI